MARKTRTPDLDQFYTPAEEALTLANWVKEQPWFSKIKTIIEPSAGTGAISQHFPGCYAFDLEPKAEGIVQKNWFDVQIETQTLIDYSADIVCDPATTLVIGNPPFGNATSLAVQFLLKACSVADNVVMIVPYYLRKYPTTHAMLRRDIVKCEFDRPDGSKKPVNVSIQHYQKCWLPAHIPANPYDLVTPVDGGDLEAMRNADFILSRSNGNANMYARTDFSSFSDQTLLSGFNHGFNVVDKSMKDKIISYLQSVSWKSNKMGLARPTGELLGDVLAGMPQAHTAPTSDKYIKHLPRGKDKQFYLDNADFGINFSGGKLFFVEKEKLNDISQISFTCSLCQTYSCKDKHVIDYLRNYDWSKLYDVSTGLAQLSKQKLGDILAGMPQPHQPDNDYYKQFFTCMRKKAPAVEMRKADFGLMKSSGKCHFIEDLNAISDNALESGFVFGYSIHDEDKEGILDYLRNYDWDGFATRCTGQASISNQRLSDIMRGYE